MRATDAVYAMADDHRRLMADVSSGGLTLAGVPAIVSGALLPFAIVTAGTVRVECSWDALARALAGSRNIRL